MSASMDFEPDRLRLEPFDRLTSARGWTTDAERARALGIAASTMSRIRNQVDAPGAKFISRALAVLNVSYGELFEPAEVEERAS